MKSIVDFAMVNASQDYNRTYALLRDKYQGADWYKCS